MEYVVGSLLRAIITYLVYDYLAKKTKPETKAQSVLLMERIRAACKLISVDTGIKFTIKKGWANPITSTDLTEIYKETKQQIIDKIPEAVSLAKLKNKP